MIELQIGSTINLPGLIDLQTTRGIIGERLLVLLRMIPDLRETVVLTLL